jgi:hypothetical protein
MCPSGFFGKDCKDRIRIVNLCYPLGMALVNNFTTQISNVKKLKQLAKRLGYVQVRGPQKGEGSIRQLLEAMIAGEVAPVRVPSSGQKHAKALQALQARGIIQPKRVSGVYAPFQPLRVSGEPVSEMVIRERR